MGLSLSKKGFIFSFLAIFLAFVIFAIAGLYFYTGDYTKDRVYTETRINYLDQEIEYFKEVYIKNVIEFSAFNSLITLLDDSNKLLLESMNNNYSKFNDLMFEAMTKGSLETVPQSLMINKTLTFFLNSFKDDFRTNHKGEFNYTIRAIKFFEKSPYYLSFLVYAQYNVTTKDDISSWNFEDIREYSIPLYGLREPTFYLEDDFNYPLKSADLDFQSLNFSLETLNKSIAEVYSLIYQEPTHKYTIGNSFLNRLLGRNIFGYKDVIGFWSFDYDENLGKVYDTALFSFGNFYGNTKLLMNFNSENFNETHILDNSAYESHAQIFGDVNCSGLGIYENGCIFDGDADYLIIDNDILNLNNTNKVSISAWIYLDNYSTDPNPLGNLVSDIFRYGAGENDVIDLRIFNNFLQMEIGNHLSGEFYRFNSTQNLSLNKWHHVVGTFDGNTGEGRLYVDGFIANEQNYGLLEISKPIDKFLKSTSKIGIGSNSDFGTEYFNGTIDELSVYSKVLTSDEIAELLNSREAKQVDYKDSFLGKGIEFDGEDDYLKIDLDGLEVTDNYTIEIWFEPDSDEDLFTRQILMLINETG